MNKNLLSLISVSSLISISPALAQDAEDDEHHTLDEVIVTATPLERTVEQLALPTSVLTAEALARKQAASIGETLASELGVSASYFGPVASRPVIRGQFGERVRVLSNGLDSLDASALSEDHAVALDSLTAQRVEIVRGPATLLYGSGAAGGLVNIVDNRIARAPLDEPFAGVVAVDLDDATGRRSMALSIDAGTEDLAFHIDWFDRETDDIEIPGFAESALLHELEEEEHHDDDDDDDHDHEEEEQFGKVENSASRTEGGAGGLTLTTENGNIGFSVSRYLSNYGIPGGHGHEEEEDHDPGEEEEAEELVSIDLEQTRYDFSLDYAFGGWIENAKLTVARNDYSHIEFEGDEVGTRFDTDGTDARLELRHRAAGRLQGAIGMQFKDISFSAIGDEAFVPGSNTTQWSVFAFEEFAVSDRWTLQGSARVEEQTLTTPGQRDYSDSAIGASIGSIWSLTDALSVSANLSFTERHPNATELYADGPHVAAQRYEIGSVILGNGVLSKEVSTNLDLTLRGVYERYEWSVTAFSNSVDDYVLLSPTASELDGFQVFEYRQADVTMYGAEAELLFDVVETNLWHGHARIFADYVFGEEDSSGSYLPQLPPLRVGGGLHFTRGAMDAGVTVEWHDDQTKTASNELPTESYTLLGAELSYRFDDPDVFVFLRGTNLSDEDARRHTSPLKDLVPLPGRSFSAGVRFNF